MKTAMRTQTIATPGRLMPTLPRGGLWARLTGVFATRRQRRQLSRLDQHLLRDIGVSPEDALTEARRPLWDTPTHWTL